MQSRGSKILPSMMSLGVILHCLLTIDQGKWLEGDTLLITRRLSHNRVSGSVVSIQSRVNVGTSKMIICLDAPLFSMICQASTWPFTFNQETTTPEITTLTLPQANTSLTPTSQAQILRPGLLPGSLTLVSLGQTNRSNMVCLASV